MKHKLKINGEIIDVDIPDWVEWITSNVIRGFDNIFVSEIRVFPKEKPDTEHIEQSSFYSKTTYSLGGFVYDTESISNLNNKIRDSFLIEKEDFLNKYEARHHSENGEWLTDKEHEEAYPNLHKIEKILNKAQADDVGVCVGNSDGLFESAPIDDGTVHHKDEENLEARYQILYDGFEDLRDEYRELRKENLELKQTIVSMAIKLENK